MNKTFVIIAMVAVVGAITLRTQLVSTPDGHPIAEDEHLTMIGTGHAVTMYKNPNCGCCTGHAEALRRHGFDVTVEETRDMAAVKERYNVPLSGESCHTSVIGNYVVEGHVPLEAIEKVLVEQPDIAGIGLPSMPIGTPGMPGKKLAPYEVYQLSESGEMSPYITI